MVHEEHEETLEELHEDGEQAVELDEKIFPGFVKGHPMSFVDFYAP